MKNISIIIIGFLLFFPYSAFSETKEIISEGAYNMGDGETPSVAESRALLNAKRVALEQAGTYVESYSKVINLRLTEDEVKVLASGLMEVTILDKKRTVVGDGIHFYVKIKAKVNPDKMGEMAKKVKEKSVIEDYKKIQREYENSRKEIEELKKKLLEAKGDTEKKQVETKIAGDERLFQANEWFEKGYNYWINKAILSNQEIKEANISIEEAAAMGDAAIDAYTKAIALNPNYARAYAMRGIAYAEKGQHDKALEDSNKAISLDPSNGFAYIARGSIYAFKGQYDKAIKDLNKAIALNPNYAEAYLGRGSIYYEKGQYDRAIKDFSKAIQLKPDYALAYLARGNTYQKLGNRDKAISDFQKACDMGDKFGCVNLQYVLEKK